MKGTIIYPERCVFCGAARTGIQDSRAFYACKTLLDATGPNLREGRSMQCVAAERELKEAFVQAGQIEQVQ
jgi:hypothetical protein